MRLLAHDEVLRRLSMGGAIDALHAALRSDDLGVTPQRAHVGHDGQELLLMPTFLGGGAGVKLVGIDPENAGRGLPRIQGVFVLFDAPGLTPSAVLDARALTTLRTAAVSGVATRLLARQDSSHLVLIGAGAQAHAHLEAMAAVRPLARVSVVSRTSHRAAALAAAASDLLDVPAAVTGPEVIAEADLICTCTTSPDPVFDGRLLPPGVHINAVGSYRTDLQEIDAVTVTSSRVVVEDRDAALAESGDLAAAQRDAGWEPVAIAADLAQVARGEVVVREDATTRTLFESVGIAYEDLIVARAVLDGT